MASSGSSTLESLCPQILKTPVRLSDTHHWKHHASSQAASSRSNTQSTNALGLKSSAHPRTPTANLELNGNQGPITMQTCIAVRDATPHRFQIIPLREAKSRQNLSEPLPSDTRDQKSRTQSPSLADWSSPSIQPFPPVARPRPNLSSLSVQSGGQCSIIPNMSATIGNICVSQTQTHEVKCEENSGGGPGHLKLHMHPTPSITSRAAHTQYEYRPASLSRVRKPRTSSLDSVPDLIHEQSKQLSKEAKIRAPNDCHTCHVVSNKTKGRAWSEDLTHHHRKTSGNCVYERPVPLWSQDDSTWRATKRHAIYSDTLVLPLFSSTLDLVGPRRTSVAPTLRNSQVSPEHSCRHYTKPYYLKTASDHPASTLSSGPVYSSQSEKDVPPQELSVTSRPLTEPPVYPSVPRLQLSRKQCDLSTFRASVVSTLGHEWPLKHSNLILELLIQLDQAIDEWNKLGSHYTI
ncbi:hypothetical protein D9756_000563 [Leucocoprinus leucothites]|uniref:Uncharacterized protein n=1 Tax=Leucocoprinus leucothites TaxID=201217 RepID=A0A8H5GEF3_9AGAR|nr:hypothetical protein D9756_000563 [Leucoagaricus leucothites]